MCKVRAGFAEEGLVDFLDGGVLVGLPDGVAFVQSIEDFGALGTDVDEVADVRMDLGLTAAVDAAAGAGHDFDEVDFELRR